MTYAVTRPLVRAMALGTVVPLVLAAPMAVAGQDASAIYSSGSKEAAYAAFKSYGDKISAQDLLGDGRSAVTAYVIAGESTAYLWDSNGAGTTPVVRTIDRAEGKSVKFKACIGEYSSRRVIACTVWKYGVF